MRIVSILKGALALGAALAVAAPAVASESELLIRLKRKIESGFRQMADLGSSSAEELADVQERLAQVDEQLRSTDDPEEAARLKEERLRLRAEGLRSMSRRTHEAASVLQSVRENLARYEALARKTLGPGRSSIRTDPEFREAARRFFRGAHALYGAIRSWSTKEAGQPSWKLQRAVSRLDAQNKLLARAVSGSRLDFGPLLERLDEYAADLILVRNILIEDFNRIQAAGIYIDWEDIVQGFDAVDVPISDPNRLLDSVEEYWQQDEEYYFQKDSKDMIGPNRKIDTSKWGEF